MCNIAGYVGDRPAVPILVELLRKQEGIDCGFYTGLATMHEGKIYYTKIMGDLDRFLAETDVLSFPGTIGIIHGRTPGAPGEGDSWAHPFVAEEDGEVKAALVLNGSVCAFAPRANEYVGYAEKFLERGWELKSRIPGKKSGLYLPDDTSVHMSEVLCQVVYDHIRNGEDTVHAMANAFYEMPKECVTLLLSLTEPDAITWSQMNFPMHVGFAEHGAYLATTSMAFPEDAGDPILLPALSSGLVRKNEFTCERFKKIPGTVPPVTYQGYAKAYREMCEAFKEGRKAIEEFNSMGIRWFDPSDCHLRQMRAVVYGVLDDLYRQGRLAFEKVSVPGMVEELQAPKVYMTLKE